MPEFIWVYELLQNCWGGQWVLMSFDRGSELCAWLRRARRELSNTNKSKAKIYIHTQQTLGKWQTHSHKSHLWLSFISALVRWKASHRACCKHCKELFHTLKAWRNSPLQRQSLYSLAMIIGWNMLNWTSPTSTEEHVAFPSLWPKIPCENKETERTMGDLRIFVRNEGLKLLHLSLWPLRQPGPPLNVARPSLPSLSILA